MSHHISSETARALLNLNLPQRADGSKIDFGSALCLLLAIRASKDQYISVTDLAKVARLSERQTFRVLKSLLELGVIERYGRKDCFQYHANRI